MRLLATLGLVVCLSACAGNSSSAKKESAASSPGASSAAPVEAMLPVPGGKIWYRKSGSGSGTPVILLHGGPGFSSFYLKPLEQPLGQDRPVVRYDQLGGGKSDRISDTTMFTIDHFVRELDSLRS